MSRPNTATAKLGPTIIGGVILVALHGGCLEVDPGFAGWNATHGHVGDNSTSTSSTFTDSDGTGVSTSVATSNDDTSESVSVSVSASSSTDTASSTSSTTSASSDFSSGLSSEDSSSSVESSDTSSVSDSTSSATTQLYRLRITNPNQSQSIGTSAALALTFDHAALVAAGAHPQGADLLVVRLGAGDERTPLARVVDFESAWNQSNTTIWFSPISLILPNSVDDTHYAVEIRSDLAGVVDDPDNVFLMWDDFSNASVSADKWSFTQSAAASHEVNNGHALLQLPATTPNGAARMTSRTGFRGTDLALEVKSRLNRTVDALDCRYGISAGLTLGPDQIPAESLWMGEGSLYVTSINGGSSAQSLLFDGINNTGFHVHELGLFGSLGYVRQDLRWLGTHNALVDSAVDFLYPHLSVEMPARCGLTDTMVLDVDWMRLRQAFEIEPTVEWIGE